MKIAGAWLQNADWVLTFQWHYFRQQINKLYCSTVLVRESNEPTYFRKLHLLGTANTSSPNNTSPPDKIIIPTNKGIVLFLAGFRYNSSTRGLGIISVTIDNLVPTLCNYREPCQDYPCQYNFNTRVKAKTPWFLQVCGLFLVYNIRALLITASPNFYSVDQVPF